VLVEDPEGHAILLTKGAPEEIFHQCSQFELDGKLSPMDPELMKGLKDEYASLSNDGSGFWPWQKKISTEKSPAQRRMSTIWF